MKLGNVLKNLIYSEGVNPLPTKIILALMPLFFFNGLTITTLFSYVPQLVKSFGTSEVDAGRQAGSIASALFVSRIFSSFIWGYIADKKGKKSTILIAASSLAITTFAFGFSNNFQWALTTRFLQGACMGIIVITKSILTDVCDDTNIALAFSILFLGFQTGMIIGPSMSGFLVFLADKYPGEISKDSFLGKYAIFVPNLIIVIGFAFSIVISIFVLPKDNKPVRSERNENIVFVEKEGPSSCNDTESYITCSIGTFVEKSTETTPLINERSTIFVRFKRSIKTSNFVTILRTRSCIVAVLLYGTFSIVGVGYMEIFPVYAATSLELKGLSMSTTDIGLLMLIYTSFTFVIQIGVVPKAMFKFGGRKTFCACILLLAVAVPFIPLIAIVKQRELRWTLLVFVQVLIFSCNSACFIAVNIFLNNSVNPSLLGSANGLGMSFSSVGRTIGPILFGFAYSWSLENVKSGQLGFPFNEYFVFFLITVICILNAAFVSRFPESYEMKKSEPVKETEPVNVYISYNRF